MITQTLKLIAHVCQRLRVEPYLVGGSVRDHLLGRESHDWDLVCRHAQRVAQATARRLSAKLITLDDQNRIYRIIQKGGITLDFAELQGKTIEQDLGRRDFSLNAMAMPLTSHRVIDPFGGQKDLKKKIVRALSRKAFLDDPLRLLRAYRMTAQFGFRLDAQTRQWIKAEHRLLEGKRAVPAGRQVARERVREELLRLFSQPFCAEALAAMDASGLLTAIFPELEAGRRVGLAYYGQGGVVKHHLQSVANVEWLLSHPLDYLGGADIAARIKTYSEEKMGGFPRSAFLKLGALLHDLGKPATAQMIRGRLRFFGHEDVGAQMVRKILEALRFSRQEGGLVRLWVANHMRPGNLASTPQLTEKATARFFRDMGEEGVGMLLVSLGDHYTYLARSQWGKAKDSVEQTSRHLLTAYYHRREAVLPPKVIDGHVLIRKLRLKPGPMIGKLLEAVRDAQAEGKVKTAEEALTFARKVLKTKD